jgi:hypothetical protein
MQIILLMVRISRGKRRERDVLVQKLICPRLACDDNFDLRYRMQATDAWCLYDSFLCERVKKEIRKRNKKTGKQSSVPPFIFIANAKRAALMFALKICERWRKIVCVRERERKKYIKREKITEREREKERERTTVISFRNAPFIKPSEYLLWLDAFFLRPEILR